MDKCSRINWVLPRVLILLLPILLDPGVEVAPNWGDQRLFVDVS